MVRHETRLNPVRETRRDAGAQGQFHNGRFGEDEMVKTTLFHKISRPCLCALLLSVLTGCTGNKNSPQPVDGSTAGPDGSTAGPDGSTAGPDGSTAGPDGSTAGPDGSTAGPDGSTSSHSYTIYSIGDSTMASYDNATYTLGTPTELRGWCQMFPQFITGGNVTFVNYGLPGRSSRDYYNDTSHNYWNTIKTALKPGDYVFIQFAHNDEVYDGLSTEEATAAALMLSENSGSYGRGNEAWGTYHDYLIKYVEETRALGANPILVGPVVRLGSFPLSATNCHNLTGNGTVPGPNTTYQSADYVGAMKDVAAIENCPYVDLTASTKTLVQSFNAIGPNGLTDAKTFVYNDPDNTHLKAYGATLFAQLAAQEMVSKGLLATDLNPSGIILSSTATNFGTLYINTPGDKIFSIHGLGLTPDSGTIAIAAPGQFTVSVSADGPFTSTLQVPYTGGQLPPTDLHVRFLPTAGGTFGGNVTVMSSSSTAAAIAVTGTCITVSNAKAIAAYSFISPAVVGAINEAAKTIAVLAPNGTSLDSLVANFTLSARASATVSGTAQVSGTTPNDFTGPVVYTVTAEDASSVNYTVTATLAVPGTGATWLFSDAVWPSGNETDGIYGGVKSLGCLSATTLSGASTKTGTLAGTSTSFTVRWQLPKNGSATSGYLAIPVVGPCNVYVAGLSSSSSTARNIVITDGTTPMTYSLPVSGSAPVESSYTYTGGPGLVYVYCNDTGGACSLYGLATRY
jgi:lysophospholipase L1-like esterase